MSENDLPTYHPNNPEDKSIKFNESFVIKLTNENYNIIDRNAKQNCKILQISSELDIDHKLAIIRTLEPSEHSNLFIFLIEHQNENLLNKDQGTKSQQLEEHLIKFGTARPLIIQQIFEAENETKFYYKGENSSEIEDIIQHYGEDCELHENIKNKLRSLLDEELQPFEDEMLKKLSFIKDNSIILRFLRTLNIQEAFFGSMVLEIAENGSKTDLLAALDASFEDNGRVLNNQAQNYIQNVFEDDEVESSSEQVSDEDQDDPMDRASIRNEDSSQSVLLTAVKHSNKEIVDFLITYCSDLIQQLPVEHQIRISTAAFDNNQLYVICDLLEFSDFPFPKDFDITNNEINSENLQSLITDRTKFHELIEQENYKEIKEFIDKNLRLRFIYSPQNITAMKKAIESKKYKTYYYLKSFGLFASEFRNLDEVLDENELKKASDQGNLQKSESICDALRNTSKSVLILCTRSLIHNRKVKKEDETKYRKHIKKWLEDVNKIAAIMIDVAASCENLVIIFDFESKFVDRTAFRDNALGLSSDTVSSRIFIGAKLGDSKREQEIKGVLAHELCHYVMSLVYDNKFLPYYKHATVIRDHFDGIVKFIDKWSTNDLEKPDDECNGIISSVFTSYPVNCFHYELIVRTVHILVLYDDDPDHSAYLQEKYQSIFDFWFTQVLPELHRYFQKNNVVIRINTTVGLLSHLAKSKIEFESVSKYMEQLIKSRITIVTTNVPRLLLINIHKHLQDKCGCLLESQNVFIEQEKIKNEQVWKDLMHLYARDVKLNIFVDCTKGKLNNLSNILNIEEFNFILAVSNEEQSTALIDTFINKDIKPTIVDINYKWSDLTEECQLMLLQTKITFQNNSKISLIDILSKNMNPDQNEIENIIEDFSSTINSHVFNLIIDRQEISINSTVDDSKKNNFEILFRNRDFLKKGIKFKNEISQEKLISITVNNKYVLISDIAGSGKSWVVKNISKLIKKQDPIRWVTYVDLKQFIEEFRKEQFKDFEFAKYFIENILKPKTKFEEEIFKKLYKNGKVSIIFDGFDEIAPDCSEFVVNLAKLFEFNDGNQLWIVTRDYFEVDLKQKLVINNVYKLNELTEEDGVNLIVSSWILMDFQISKTNDFENLMQNSPNLTEYREKATGIVQNVNMSTNQSIGLTLLFSMIADGFKDDNFVLDDLERAKIFTRFVQTMYTRWLKNGQLREDANALSLDYELNFKEFHQYFAILSLFPELVYLFFPDYDISEWPEVEIIAGGLLNKIGSSYSFNHETFREYFIADFIFKAIKKTIIKKEILELLVKVLTIEKYGIIRMFLNDFIENSSILEKVQLELEKSVEKFNNMENLSEYFTKNLEHLAKCVIAILKKDDYENVKKILNYNISAVASRTKELKMFSIFTEFLFSCLRLDDLKDMINSQNILQKIIGSDSNVEIFEHFEQKLEAIADREFIQQELKLISSGQESGNGNIFYHLGTSENLPENKVQKFFEIIQKYLDDSEIVELMDKCNYSGQSILKILIENPMNFKPFLDGAEFIFTNQNLLQKFKNIVNKTDLNGQSVLHWSASKEGIDFHTSVWKLIQKTFENQEELGSFVLQKDESENNHFHLILVYNSADVIEFTINKLKEILSESDYHEILRSKGYYGRNLLQLATVHSKEVKAHQILWKTFRDSCNSDEEFFQILGQVDEHDNNVFHLAASFSISEIFIFMEEQLEKVASHDKIKKLFIKLGRKNSNLLQSASIQNKSSDFHETLWKIIKKYFTSAEILELIKNRDIYGNNLLINVILKNTKEIVDLTWKEVKELLNNNDLITEELEENIQKCENIMKGISGPTKGQNDESEILKLKWLKNENSEASKLFDEEIQRLAKENLNNIKFENLQFFATDEDIENHKKLWKNLVKIHTNYKNLKKLLFKKDENDFNFIHHLIISNTADVIEFTLNKYKEHLSESDYQEILRLKVQLGRNLLQVAAICSKKVEIHQILWKTLRDSCKTDEEFLELLGEDDEYGSNVFHIAVAFTTNEIFEFMEKELEKVASRDQIRKLFIKLGHGNSNLLQAAAGQNKSLELHEMLWKILRKYFNQSEILKFVKHLDEVGKNLLIIAKEWNIKEILELTWTEVKKVITALNTDNESGQRIKQCENVIQKIAESKDMKDKEITDEEVELLNLEWIKIPNSGSSNLFQDVLRHNLNVRTLDDLKPMISNIIVSNHNNLWEHLNKKFENRQELAKLLSEKDKDGNNFIHLLVIRNIADVIKFTFNKFKENLNESDYQEILRSKGQFGRSFLQNAANCSKEVKTHQILWKTLRDSCKSDEEFLEILGEMDDNGDNVFNIAAIFASGKIFKFIQKELEKIDLQLEIKKVLTNLGSFKRNLLQSAVRQNKSLELHEALWVIVEKYFNSLEIIQFVKHRDVYGYNVLLNVVKYNTKEVKELTWNKVRNTLITIGYENNENINKCDEIMKNDLNFDKITKDENEVLKLNWIDSKNSTNLFEDSIQLLMQKAVSDKSLEDLMLFMTDANVENHEEIWEYLEKSFKSYEELKKLFFENEKYGNNFFHFIVIYNKAETIEFTIQKLKENLTESDYHEFLRSKGQYRRNLLQLAAICSKEVKTHQILWKTLRDSCKSNEEFLEILREDDEHGSDVFTLAASFTTSEILEFIEKELEKTKLQEEIKKLFIKLGCGNINLLQAAAVQNKSLELHKILWTILRKYFSLSELLEFIIHFGEQNVLKLAIENNVNEVMEFTWQKVKGILSELYTDTETVQKIEECEKVIQKINDKSSTEDEMEILNFEWIKPSGLFNILTQNILKGKISVRTLDDLMPIMFNKNIFNHQILWEHLQSTFENRQELAKLISEKDEDGNNFIYLLVAYNTADVIEFTINKYKEILSESDYHKILRSKGHFGRNLLQFSACRSIEVKTHQILWKIFRDSCNSDEEFLEILRQVDEKVCDVFHLAAAFTKSEVFEFMIAELEKLTNSKGIRKLLTSFGQTKMNLLQFVATQNKSLETNETVWKIIFKYFKNEEILEFVKYCDGDGDNLLCNAVFWNTIEIVEFTWKQIKTCINTKDAQVEYLNKKGRKSKSLYQLSSENQAKDSQVADWVQQMMQEYEIQ